MRNARKDDAGDALRSFGNRPSAIGNDRGGLFAPSPRENASDQQLIDTIANAPVIDPADPPAEIAADAEILARRLDARGTFTWEGSVAQVVSLLYGLDADGCRAVAYHAERIAAEKSGREPLRCGGCGQPILVVSPAGRQIGGTR